MKEGTAERLCAALAELVTALCREDVRAIENASFKLQKLLELEADELNRSLDHETLREVRNLMEAAQCLVWVKLLSAAEAGKLTINALIHEKV
ncbi:MAG: hypothetical protein NZ805_02105 [Armatimonadetes bacterium]|nr:hypothetical protein [Armatimonadota bacterium]MDW8026835.1 hypothetical protein [Armatimonadota bacterium]